MNNFASIVRLDEFQFSKVKYYSIQFDDNDKNEFYDFLNRMESVEEATDDLDKLFVWIEIIGETVGAKKEYFRNEAITADVSALPPPAAFMRAHKISVSHLRLYCLRVNDCVVFLFNGGVKTQTNAKDCPNVGPYIKQANRIVQEINKLFFSKEVCWNNDKTDIRYSLGLGIEI